MSGPKSDAVVSLSLRIAAFVSGIGFAGYDKLFKRHLGMQTVTNKQFYATIEITIWTFYTGNQFL